MPSFLMLHSVGDEVVDPKCPNNTIRPDELRELIVALRKDGYTFKTFKDALANRRGADIASECGCFLRFRPCIADSLT